MARAPSACLRIASTVAAMNPARFQFFLAPQISKTKFCRMSRAAFGVIHFGMKFDSVASSARMLDRSDGIVRAAGYVETCGQVDHVVAVAVPDFESCRQTGE